MTDDDHAAIDELLHRRMRLALVAFPAGAEFAEFAAVRAAIKTTDGNRQPALLGLGLASSRRVAAAPRNR